MSKQDAIIPRETSSSLQYPQRWRLPNAQLKDVPPVLIKFILEDLKFLEIYLFSLISKRFYNDCIAIMEKFAQKFLLNEFPYFGFILREIYAEKQTQEIKINVNCFTTCNNRLMTAFDIYDKRTRTLPDYFSSMYNENSNFVNSFQRALEMGNVGAAISILTRHGKNNLLLSFPTFSGKTIPGELVSYLPSISLSEVNSEVKKSPLSESLEITYNNRKRLLDFLFELTMQHEFAKIWRPKPQDLHSIPTGQEISKQILADAEKALTPDTLKEMADTHKLNAKLMFPDEKFKPQDIVLKQVFQLFAFSYACYQLNIVDVIRKKYLMPDSIILAEPLMIDPLITRCFGLGQVKLIIYLLGKIGRQGITEFHVQQTIESGNVRLMGLLKSAKININQHEFRSRPALEAILSKRNPILTILSLRNVHISSLADELKKKIILQLNIIGATSDFLNTWKKEQDSNFDDPKFEALKKLASPPSPTPALTH